ncbi:MAG: tyrosine-type recombinase/integrase [Bacillota bacterium]
MRTGDFLRGLEVHGYSSASLKAYRMDLAKFSEWYRETAGEDPQPSSVGPLDIADFKRHLLSRKQKPATINRAMAALSKFFEWTVGQGLSPANPVKGIPTVQAEPLAPKGLDRREQLALMRAVTKRGKPRDTAIITLILHTGLRASEVCSLDLGDVRLGERSGVLVVREGKGVKRREIPLNSTARHALTLYLGQRKPEGEALLTSQKGGRLKPGALWRMVSKVGKDAGLDNLHPHTLRHTFLKNLRDAGEDLDRVAAIAGHANLNTTARYTRPTLKDLQEAVEKVSWS